MSRDEMRKKGSEKKACVGVLSILFLLVLPFVFHPTTSNARPAPVLIEVVEEAALAGNWADVSELLASVDTETPSPVLRLIKAHSCLALNRNNESLCLFLSASSDEDLKTWGDWTRAFVEKNPKSAVAYYFRGDALARLEQWDSALKAFNRALEFYPNHPLALNARGTVYSAIGKWDHALVDLKKATIARDSLADAHASLGAMWIQRREGAEGALESFNRALALSPDFVLAYNGIACAKYVLGRWEEANKDMADAGKYFTCRHSVLPILSHNLAVLTISAKRAQFPCFSKSDFVNWKMLRRKIRDPKSILYQYFRHLKLPEEPSDLVASKFNEILEIPQFYDRHKNKIGISRDPEGSDAALKQLKDLIAETGSLRQKSFAKITDKQKDKIRKLNRMILEYLFPGEVIQLAMGQIDSPGFSLERGVGLVDSMSYKIRLSDQALKTGNFRMNNIYRPLADHLSHVPIVGGIGTQWNRHLDNQIRINNEILRSRGVPVSPSGGVDLGMRKAYIDEGNWAVGTWFGLAYHVEALKPFSLAKEGSK